MVGKTITATVYDEKEIPDDLYVKVLICVPKKSVHIMDLGPMIFKTPHRPSTPVGWPFPPSPQAGEVIINDIHKPALDFKIHKEMIEE